MGKFFPDIITNNDPGKLMASFNDQAQNLLGTRDQYSLVPELALQQNNPAALKLMTDTMQVQPSAAELALGMTPGIGDAMDINELYQNGLPELPKFLNEALETEAGKNVMRGGYTVAGLAGLLPMMSRAPVGKMQMPVKKLQGMNGKLIPNMDDAAAMAPSVFAKQAPIMPELDGGPPVTVMPNMLQRQAGAVGGWHGSNQDFNNFDPEKAKIIKNQ